MKRSLAVLVAALALPAAAAAKGPSKAEVTGPGIHKAIVIKGAESPGTPLMNFAGSTGFFPQVFNQSPDPTTRSRPDGKLGPKLSVVYTVPGPDGGTFMIRQDVYPYATPYPVSYMKPGQKIFMNPGGTHGGWYTGDPRMKSTLVRAGLPATPAAGGGGGSSTPWWIAGVVGGVALLVGAAWLLVRRRPHGTTAPEPT
jgi:hypothetical protein